MSNTKTETKKSPVIYIELCDQRGSGFIMDGTEGTKHELELKAPSARFIPNNGFRIATGKNSETGEVEVYNEPIAYRKHQREISVEKLRLNGFDVSRKQTKDDKIIVENGSFSVAREGSFMGLYDYLMASFYSEQAEGRPESLEPIYRIIELDKKAEEFNDSEMIASDALQFIKTLYLEGPKVDGNKTYKYEEAKINAICEMLVVYAETFGAKIQALIGIAKRDPKNFLDKVLKLENTIVTEIAHALELNVIKFEGNTAQYVAKDKILAPLGKGNMSQDRKINALADLLRTAEYHGAYQELKAEIETEQEKQFN